MERGACYHRGEERGGPFPTANDVGNGDGKLVAIGWFAGERGNLFWSRSETEIGACAPVELPCVRCRGRPRSSGFVLGAGLVFRDADGVFMPGSGIARATRSEGRCSN